MQAKTSKNAIKLLVKLQDRSFNQVKLENLWNHAINHHKSYTVVRSGVALFVWPEIVPTKLSSSANTSLVDIDNIIESDSFPDEDVIIEPFETHRATANTVNEVAIRQIGLGRSHDVGNDIKGKRFFSTKYHERLN